jgi:hypothetical protein
VLINQFDGLPTQKHGMESPSEEEVPVESVIGRKDAVLLAFTHIKTSPLFQGTPPKSAPAAHVVEGANILYVNGKRSDRPKIGRLLDSLPAGLWVEMETNRETSSRLLETFEKEIPQEPCTLNTQDRLRHAGMHFVTGPTLFPSAVLAKLLFSELVLKKNPVAYKLHLVHTDSKGAGSFYSEIFRRDYTLAGFSGTHVSFLPFVSDALGKRRAFCVQPRVNLRTFGNLCSGFLSALHAQYWKLPGT